VTRRAVPAAVLLVLGVLALALVSGTAGKAAGMMLIGTACVWVVALAFYEIGAQEDREREKKV
jgi:hypothetical protein